MTERVASDHSTVSTVRATVSRGGGPRPYLRLPDDLDLAGGDVIRLSIDGTAHHARVTEDTDGLLVRGAYATKQLVRNPGEGENHLAAWLRASDRSDGSSVAVDEVTPGYFYGVRVPGERTVYEVLEPPKQSLSAIAETLDDPS